MGRWRGGARFVAADCGEGVEDAGGALHEDEVGAGSEAGLGAHEGHERLDNAC